MATTIKLKNGSGAPTTGDLVQGEPAFDLTNKRLYTEDSGGTVIEVGTNPTSLTTGGLTTDGTVLLQGDSMTLKRTSASAENYIVCTPNSSVDLFWNGASRLTTTSTGIDVTGSVVSDGLTVDTSTLVVDAVNNRVGIGTASPAVKTQIVGSGAIFRISDDVSTSGTIELSASSSEAVIHANTYASAVPLVFKNASTERMRIDSSGNVLVGKNSSLSANSRFEVATTDTSTATSSGAGAAINIQNLSTTNNTYSTIYFTNGGGGVDSAIYGVHEVGNGTDTGRTGSIAFATAALGGGVLEKMRIDGSGQTMIQGTAAGFDTTAAQNGLQLYYETDTGLATLGSYSSGGSTSLTFHTNSGGSASVEAMRIDSSGNLLVNSTSAGALTSPSTGRGLIDVDGTSDSAIELKAGGSTYGYLYTSSSQFRVANLTANPVTFFTNNAERMRIDSSGNLLVGTTTQPNGSADGIKLNAASSGRVFSGGTTGSFNQLLFFNPNGQVGSISTSGSTTSYTTSSDERLKENVTDAPAGNIDSIKVRSFDWKADGSHQTYGMVAQELVDVAPEAVSQGENEDDMWGVDYSKLVPMMIKEIQDLKAEVAALKGA
jgi:hypothetical protein